MTPPFKDSNKPNAAACSIKITVKMCKVIIITNILKICDNFVKSLRIQLI